MQHYLKKILDELPQEHPARPAIMLQLVRSQREYQAALQADQDRYWASKLSEPTAKKGKNK